MVDISLIKNWHEKAKEDYFSRYIFEYLAFEAFLKKYKYSEEEIRDISGNISERSYIQKIKNESDYAEKWKLIILKNEDLKKVIEELCHFLENEPLILENNWWGCLSFKYAECISNGCEGRLKSGDDFIGIVDFWYQVRNNLFHAGKNPDSERDEKLVMFAYKTLSLFFEEILLSEIEYKTIRPAIWEEFEHKFFKGEAEVMVKVNNSEACANVYELLFSKESLFPIFLQGKKIDRNYIIEKLSFNLVNLYGDEYLLKDEWDRISRQAKSDDEKKHLKIYFGKIMPLLKDVLRDL